MRVFIAIDISDELKDKIAELQKRFSQFDIKLVEKENLHFCLKFLGEIEDSKIENVKKTLQNACEDYGEFDLNIKGIGVFPSRSYIRVIWLDVKEGYNTLTGLAETIDSALSDIGIEKSKEFKPHLTLGRVKSARSKEKLSELLKELGNIEIGTMKVSKVSLIQSVLTPSGPKYDEIFSANL